MREIDVGFFRGSLHQPGELVEAVDRCEAVALQDELGFDVLNVVERVAVAISSLSNVGHTIRARLPMERAFSTGL